MSVAFGGDIEEILISFSKSDLMENMFLLGSSKKRSFVANTVNCLNSLAFFLTKRIASLIKLQKTVQVVLFQKLRLSLAFYCQVIWTPLSCSVLDLE